MQMWQIIAAGVGEGVGGGSAKSQDSVHKTQVLRRKGSRSEVELDVKSLAPKSAPISTFSDQFTV